VKEDPEGDEVSDEDWKAKNKEEGDKEDQSTTDDGVKFLGTDVAGDYDAKGDGDAIETGSKSKGLSEYERTKAKNIAALKLELAKLDEQYPVLEELKQMAGPKKSVTKKKAKPKGEAVIRRESIRNKSKSALP
jgi:hypothetical protein